jgi:acetyl esterase/lipase
MRQLRRGVTALVGLAVVATTAAGCEWPDGTRYVDTVFAADQVRVTTDVTYDTVTNSQGQQITLELDVYSPPAGDTVTERPVVIWGFGGGWVAGDKNQLSAYARDSARRGYVGVAIEYRTSPTGGNAVDLAGAAYEDTLSSVQFLKDHAAQYGIDPDAIVTAGYSAGAINALNTAIWPGERGPATSPVAGAVGIAGFSFGQSDPGEPPILQFHGADDTLVPEATGRNTCDQHRAAGNHCTFFSYPGEDHFVAFTQLNSIAERTADWIFEQVLWPLGYRA